MSFPRFEKSLELLKQTRRYIDADWAALDGELEKLVYRRLAAIRPVRRDQRARIPYGTNFTEVKAVDRRLGERLIPEESARQYSAKEKLLLAKRPPPPRCEVCEESPDRLQKLAAYLLRPIKEEARAPRLSLGQLIPSSRSKSGPSP